MLVLSASLSRTLGALLWPALLLAVPLLYFGVLWAWSGQTPGMSMFRIRVVRRRDGGPIGAVAAVVRLFGQYLSGAILWLGFLWAFFDIYRRGWHDLLAGTIVVRDPAFA